ncbi:MAG: response regulator [Abditibacteriales bacterium]|nr:response regulator [Abditibacteriales bacterium]MDW8365932.1 response regulator [Abditibacteriales bacterium]
MKTVLVVDDDVAVVELLRANLEMAGHRVAVAYDGVEALAQIQAERPDLVILDIQMPRLSGWDVLRELRRHAETETLPVIMLTIFGDRESITRGWREGVDCYIPKPFKVEEVMAMVARLLEVSEESPFRS